MRTLVATFIGAATGIFAFAAGFGLTGHVAAAIPIGALSGAALGWACHGWLPALDPAASLRPLKVVSLLATVAALVMLARLSVFMIDSSHVGSSWLPASRWELEHSCLTAYVVAGQALPTTPNVYDAALYDLPGDPKAPRVARKLGPFNIDVYEYPPPFLLLPRALRLDAGHFDRARALWFGLTGGFMLFVMVLAARMLGPAAGTRTLLLAPLVWLSMSALSTIQKGNIQPVVIAASVLAMILFERRRFALGGALLAFFTLSKLYPGLLIVYLLAGRRWRAVAWTGAMALAFLGVSLLDTGWRPYAAFLDHLPGLVGGEAFPAFRRPGAMAINLSVPGLVFKAKLFGVDGGGFPLAKLVGWIYTLVAVAVAAWAGRRAWRDDEKPIVWLAVLILATLRSPFLPQTYAVLPPLWLLTVLGARAMPTQRTLVVVLASWAVFNLYWPADWPQDLRLTALFSLAQLALAVTLSVVALRPATVEVAERTPSREPSLALEPA